MGLRLIGAPIAGFVQREDLADAIRLLGRLDRLAAKLGDDPERREISERLGNLPPRRAWVLTVLTG